MPTPVLPNDTTTPIAQICQDMTESADRTLELLADLRGGQWLGPQVPIVNPPRWELGHVAWFYELWVLRNLFEVPTAVSGSDDYYNSSDVHHDTRWDLPLPSSERAQAYLRETIAHAIERLAALGTNAGHRERYFYRLATFHGDMHNEAFTYTRQTLSRPAPSLSVPIADPTLLLPEPGFELRDVEVPGGTLILGARPDEFPFIFDNEKWAHEVEVAPFKMANTPTTSGQFRAFVEDGGYERDELWSAEGLAWRNRAGAKHPVYWQPEPGGSWSRRVFDSVVPLDDFLPIIHVSWYEAEAYCAWAGRRLATEAEWEYAASLAGGSEKRIYPWGNEPPTPERANLDWAGRGVIDVRALPAGDTPLGLRQMMGNVWEWTATPFGPFPGFEMDPYIQYSEPWFGDHYVLRGGAWTTRSRMIRNGYRNFYKPDRRDVLNGFRTCAKE